MLEEKLLSAIEEAKIKNYSDFILKYDLQKIIENYENECEEKIRDKYVEGYEEGCEEAKNEYYESAFEDGKCEGVNETKEKFIEYLNDKINSLKNRIKEGIEEKDLQIALAEIVAEMDEELYY